MKILLALACVLVPLGLRASTVYYRTEEPVRHVDVHHWNHHERHYYRHHQTVVVVHPN
jgi:hypothetical protein